MTSICHAAYNIALDINIPVIAVMTESGSTAGMVSNFRPDANIVAICPYEKVARQLNIFWGVSRKSTILLVANAYSIAIPDQSVTRISARNKFLNEVIFNSQENALLFE